MCGIVGVIGARPAAPLLLDALRRLEYRGYDSAGIATLVNGHIDRRRAEGKLANLAASLDRAPLAGTTGIGHTRWATHGAPTESNAHPHGTARVSLVHNGIIENHAELRAELEAAGQEFSTETDTETVAQLVDLNLKRGMTPIEAAGAALRRLEGAYALAMIFAGHPELMVGAQHGAPLAVGFGDDEMFVGSDALALAPLTRRIAYLRDGDWTVVDRQGAQFFDLDGNRVEREVKLTRLTGAAIGKGNFRHFMEKELHEHPAVIGDTLHRMIDPGSRAVALPDLPFDFAKVPRITMSACGSAFYASLVGRWWFEAIARHPERRRRCQRVSLPHAAAAEGRAGPARLAIGRDRRHAGGAALHARAEAACAVDPERAGKQHGAGKRCGAGNRRRPRDRRRQHQGVHRPVDGAGLPGPGGGARDAARSTRREEAAMTAALLEVPSRAAEVLENDAAIQAIAHRVAQARDVLFLGRGNCYPIALEGALKLKEISYIHAEGYAAGEMKHGPIALIDPSVPVIAIAPSGPLFEKTASNLQEAAARGGKVIVFSDAAGAARLKGIAAETVVLPSVDPFVAPILYAIPVQMLAYDVAVLKGTDVDQPRNLAKSVTVE